METNIEIIVCKLINGEPFSSSITAKIHARNIVIKLEHEFGKINRAIHVGGDHSMVGDIVLETEHGVHRIELKFITSSGEAKGTLANTSQDIISNQAIINGAIGWKQWRINHRYANTILTILRETTPDLHIATISEAR